MHLYMLHTCAQSAHLGLSLRLMFFLAYGLQNGTTALMWASIYGHPAVVKMLLGAGADKEATDSVSDIKSHISVLLRREITFSVLFLSLYLSSLYCCPIKKNNTISHRLILALYSSILFTRTASQRS